MPKKQSPNTLLPLETKIEVIAINGNDVYKKTMTFGESLKIDKKTGWKYYSYQLGQSKFTNVIDLDKKQSLFFVVI